VDKGEGVLQMQTFALFDAKKSGFFEIYGVSAGGGGLRQCGQGERGQFFAIMCGRLLWKVPNLSTLAVFPY